MASVPVFCDSCGSLFVTENVFGGDARQVTFQNVSVGPCPVCGNAGKVLDGTFDFVGQTINVLSAPEWSLEKLGWMQARIEAARQGTVPAETVVEEVGEQAPELQALMASLLRQGWSAIKVLVVLLAIVGFAQSEREPPASKKDLEQATDSILHSLRHQPISPHSNTPRSTPVVGPPARAPTTRPKTQPESAHRKRSQKPKKTYGQHKKRKNRH